MKLITLLTPLFLLSCGSAEEEKKETVSEDSKTPTEETVTEETAEPVQASFKTINTDEFEKQIESPCTVLDVRTPGEIAEGIIPNAVVMNIQDADFSEQIKTLDKSQPVCVYCKSGGRSARASEMLSSEGYTVFNLAGGMDGWKAAKKEVKK